MNSIYTQSVADVPKDYNQATTNYKKHVYIALAGIIAFFGMYLFLTYWFFNSAYRLFTDIFSGGESGFMHLLVGLASLFLGIFMIKAFFFVETKYDVKDREVKPEDEPLLFDFLYKLADEIGAPRPHKVYLSNRVNAAVFYDLSFLNLFFPSKKNLEIGLGLINVLNLGEFKAVLAHEFGHFAQRSMLIGRWVYIANQIANSIINKRDALDSFLNGLSSFDIRIAWIGWILSIIVWSIRSVVELIFRVVVLSQRALSREMEFQADLISVSVTGSDALIHALHKLQAADAALSSALNSASIQLENEKAIKDLYSIQSNAIEKTAYILNDKNYGKSPSVPSEEPETFRVFSNKIAQPPKMWSTHPPDQEREENAKKRYITGSIDSRDSWDLFKNPKETRILLTKDLIDAAKVKSELVDETEALQLHNAQYEKSYFKPKYKGVYLGRYIYEDYQESEEMYLSDISQEEVSEKLKALYPDSLVEDLEDFTTLRDELAQLEAIRDKKLQAAGTGGIWHRGTQIRKSELPEVIEQVSEELSSAKAIITHHDKLCRTSHLLLAEKLGNNWPEYLKSLGKVIHYCEHNSNNINDAYRVLVSVLTIVMADNRVSDSELSKLLKAANNLHAILRDVNAQRKKIVLDENLLKELGTESWAETLEEFSLPYANSNNINEWINYISSWVTSYGSTLDTLRSEALEVLLRTEENLLSMNESGNISPAPLATQIDVSYERLIPGNERDIDIKLSIWDKFIAADGIVPAIAKFAVAASIVGGTVFMAGSTGQSEVSIYNGLEQAVTVDLNGTNVTVQPHSSKNVNIDATGDFQISSSLDADGSQIEQFSPSLATGSAHYIYNIAGAALLHEYNMYYGLRIPGSFDSKEKIIGAKKWVRSRANHILTEPPETISTSSSGEIRSIVEAASNIDPYSLVSVLQEEEEIKEMIEAHLLFDPLTNRTIQWTGLAGQIDQGKEILHKRLKRFPNEVVTVRVLMDIYGEENKDLICTEFLEKALQEPDNADLNYISCRCKEEPEQTSCFHEAEEKWPEHSWTNYASAYSYIQQNKWESAYQAYQRAYVHALGLKDPIAVNLEKIGRLLAHNGSKIPLEQNLESEYLDFHRTVEEGSNEDPSFYAYHMLSTGFLEKARELSKSNPNLELNIRILSAASQGAEEAWIEEVLALKTESLTESALLTMAGLYLRKGKSIEEMKENLDALTEGDEVNIHDFIKALKESNYPAGEKFMTKASLRLKGQLALLAYVAKGSEIPLIWQNYVKFLLFDSEKPYVGDKN